MADISITYDLLFDVLRTEKSREDLQKFDDTFYNDVINYIHSKESIINNPNTPHGERELTRIQLGNVKKILIELYDRREKKIINLAIYKIKTGSGIITTNGILPEEKLIFDSLYHQLLIFRECVLYNVIGGKNMDLNRLNSQLNHAGSENTSSNSGSSSSVESVSKEVPLDLNDTSIKSIRFVKPVPRFLGLELETYGPFEENDIASLPSVIANILVRKSRAEEMHIN